MSPLVVRRGLEVWAPEAAWALFAEAQPLAEAASGRAPQVRVEVSASVLGQAVAAGSGGMWQKKAVTCSNRPVYMCGSETSLVHGAFRRRRCLCACLIETK